MEADGATAVEAPPLVQLFEVSCDRTRFGDTVVIVGSTSRLGKWLPTEGVRMETDSSSWPLWHAWVSPPIEACDFKFAVISASGDIYWEENDNRQLHACTNRVAAIFGISSALSRTSASDAMLFTTRPVFSQPQSQPAASLESAPPVQMPCAPPLSSASPLCVPPPLGLGTSFMPLVPVAYGSTESSPCCSRCSSRKSLSRPPSQSALRHGSSLSGSRVSFSNITTEVMVMAS